MCLTLPAFLWSTSNSISVSLPNLPKFWLTPFSINQHSFLIPADAYGLAWCTMYHSQSRSEISKNLGAGEKANTFNPNHGLNRNLIFTSGQFCAVVIGNPILKLRKLRFKGILTGYFWRKKQNYNLWVTRAHTFSHIILSYFKREKKIIKGSLLGK